MTTIKDLLDGHCQPLKGPQHLLSEERSATLLGLLPHDWDVVEDGKALRKIYRFPDYHKTIAFVNGIAEIAHREDHHPDLGVHYDRVVVRYATHDVGGISENDFICAAKVQALYDRLKPTG